MAHVHGLVWRGLGLVVLVHAIACSDDGVPATTDDPSVGSTSATDPSGTSGDPTITGTTAESGVTDAPESTGPGETSSNDATTGTTSPSDTSGPGSTDSGSSTGDPGEACVQADECVVVDNCCDCTVLPAGVDPPECDMPCDQTECSAIGIVPVAECVLGSCELADVPCNPLDVACDSDPPECAEGTRASVDLEAQCWTGSCVPSEFCDAVSSCDDCPDDEVCVELIAHFPTITCSPIPPECDGTPSCDCMGDAVCVGAFDACGDDGSSITCSCPVC